MIEKTDTLFLGYRVFVDHGVIIKPKWWDILRLIGLRERKITHTVPKGQVLLNKENHFMTVRGEDLHSLYNDPAFPRPPAYSEGAQRMGIDTIRNAQ